MSEAPIVITGANGGIGSRVARRLAADGARLRLVVRDPARAPDLAPELAGRPAAEVAVATYDDPEALARAFDGAAAVLFVSAHEAENRLAQHLRVADAAAAAGVGHLVYTSFLGAAPDATFTLARDHFHTEVAVVESGVPHTFLRDSLYADVLPHFVGADGVIRGPAGVGRFAPVSRADVADAAAAVLAEPASHAGRTYDLTGPELHGMAEVADLIAAVAGRRITYHAETLPEAYASRSGYGAPDWEVAGWVTSYAAIGSGELAVVSAAVPTLTGRPPKDLAEWLVEHPESWAHLVGRAG